MVSMILGYRYPESAKGLLLIWMPSDAQEMVQTFANIYQQSADAVMRDGMKALVERDDVRWGHFKDHAKKNTAVRDLLLRMEPAAFAATMKRCRELAVTNMHRAGLTEGQVKQIGLPSMLIPGNNPSHPLSTAEMLKDLMPKACLSDPLKHLSTEVGRLVAELEQSELVGMDRVKQKMTFYAPTIGGFIAGVETCEPH